MNDEKVQIFVMILTMTSRLKSTLTTVESADESKGRKFAQKCAVLIG